MQASDLAQYRKVVEESGVFKGLPPEALEQILRHGMWLDAKAGEQVLFENMRGGMGLSVIVSGQLEVLRGDGEGPANGQGVRLASLGPGACLGEYSLIDGQSTSASVRAVENAKLFFLPRGAFLHIVDHDAHIGRAVYRNLVQYLVARLRQNNQAQSR